jgi:flavodoxin I
MENKMKKLSTLLFFLLFTLLSDLYSEETAKCYDKIEKIKIINPELFEYGMTESLKNSAVIYDLNDVIKFNRHLCAGSVAGYIMTKNALKKLFPNESPVQGDIKITASQPSGATDMAGMITGTLDHFGVPAKNISIDTELFKGGELTIIFERISTNKKVVATFHQGKLLNTLSEHKDEFLNLKKKLDAGDKSSNTTKAFGKHVQELVCELISKKNTLITTKQEKEMKKTAVFYGSTTGTTKRIAEAIAEKLGADLFDIAKTNAEIFQNYDNIVLGTSTWGIGAIQDDWENGLLILDKVDMSNKKIAIFGLGDQMGYPDSFVDGMKDIYDKALEKKATVTGHFDTDGYSFSESKAIADNKFVGLAIDEDTQSNLTDERINRWIAQLKSENF